MSGKIIGIVILLAAVIAGAGLYYLQVYGYYREVTLTEVRLLPQDGSAAEDIPVSAIRAIDADSSPIRFRACFTTDADPEALTPVFRAAPEATPRNAPGWFDCFDAAAIGALIENGRAQVFIGEKNVHYGVDRLVAISDSGRGFIWHELNDCGEKAYDGTVVGETCPELPTSD